MVPRLAFLPPPTPTRTAIDSLELAACAAQLADEKKGTDIKVLALDESARVADYIVLATGKSRPQVRAMYEEIHSRMKAAGVRHARAEGVDLGWWILLDFGDVVVHLMQPEARTYYDLDGLYSEATEVAWSKVERPSLPAARNRRARRGDA